MFFYGGPNRVKDKYKLQQTFSVDPVYLRHENSDQATDFMHWQIPLSRRFRSLKLWFVMRCFGLKNLQGHIRHGVEMAKLLESLVRCDPNFDMPADRHLGLVVFCLKEGNALTQELLRRLTRSRTMYLVPADIDGKRIIRFTVTSQLTTSEDIIRDWDIIRKMAADLLAEEAEKQAVSKMEEQQSPVRKTVEKLSETNQKSGSENRPRRTVRSLSCSSEPLPGPIGPPFGHNTDPLSKPLSSSLGKRVLRKLTKFYSLPSFCHLWVQCGRYQVCCPVRGLQIAPKLRSPQNPGPPLGVGDSAVGLVPL
ncbi:unnamed protein product [Oncorhynchus mykiss]|uniref:Histidine decarboxylase n=1 Tax=Oncorhynchus mykiss TaxID=8022 RepID=A0A060YKQ4_ONCMY|nr:unnamed protein product [Oncorhynchus mykiss]